MLYVLFKNKKKYIRSHCIVSKLTCWRAPIDICFTSSLTNIPNIDFAIWEQADSHATCATSSWNILFTLISIK